MPDTPITEDKSDSPSSEPKTIESQEPKDDGKSKERERILALLEITDDPKELKKFIENDLDPAKAALQVLKQMRSERKKASADASFPSAFVSDVGSSKAQDSIRFAKKMGVIR